MGLDNGDGLEEGRRSGIGQVSRHWNVSEGKLDESGCMVCLLVYVLRTADCMSDAMTR